MTQRIIDADVLKFARKWAGDSPEFARLIQAVVDAEGNIVRAVAISVPSVATRDAALDVLCRSACHALIDYVLQGGPASGADFVEFWARRWAPKGVKNDPTNLNANWPKNVKQLWFKA